MKLCAASQFPFVCLRDCGEVVTGSTPPKANSKFWGGEIPFVTPAQLGFQLPITIADEYVTREGADRGRLLPEGAVLVCCIGSLGKTGIVGVPLISNQQINAVIFDPIQVDARYGYHAAGSLTPLLEHFAPSTTVKIVKKSAFEEFQIPLPPLAEQKRIAGILDAADALRAKRRDALAQLDTLLQSTFLDMFGDPVANPRGWGVRELGEVAGFHAGSTLPAGEDFVGQDGGFLYLKVGDLNHILNKEAVVRSNIWGKEAKKGITAPKDAVVIPKRGGAIGTNKKRLLSRKSVLDPNLMAISGSESLHHVYLHGWFHTFDLMSITSGSTVPQLNKRDLAPLRIPLPPVDLQHHFAAIVQSVERQKTSQRTHLAELDTLFASLQSRAFRGDL